MKIGIIIPKNLVKITNKVIKEFDEEIRVITGTMNETITIAKELEDLNYDCIIARGGTYTLLSNLGIKIPIVPIPITNIDFFQAVSRAEKISQDIVIMAFNNMMPANDSYAKIAERSFRVIQVKDEGEVKAKLEQLSRENNKVVVGGGIINRFIEDYNMESVIIESGEESIKSAIEDAIRIVNESKKEKEAVQRINAIIENTKDAIICVDNEGIVNLSNQRTSELLNLDYDSLIGKDINTILPELEIDESIKNPIEDIGSLTMIKENKYIVSKIPIKVNGEVVDVIIIIKDIDEIHDLEEKIRLDIAETGHFTRYKFSDVIGNSFKTKETIRIGKEYAKVNSTILIEGETGTGKEVLAQSIHNHSERANRAFVAVNCAAIPENLLESELFGYVGGAFTGADRKGKRGLFEVAHKGTIFLDEISEMNPMLQGRLLRVLQEKEIMRIGSNKLIPIDVRVIAATNKDIYKLTRESKFREDLYYRINVLKIYIHPIRERKEDILCFLDEFIGLYCNQLGKKKLELADDLKEYLMSYDWPGNVREIRNFCERLCIMSKTQKLSLSDIDKQIFDIEVKERYVHKAEKLEKKEFVEEIFNSDSECFEYIEKKAIENSLECSNNNIGDAALALGISRTTMWRKMKKYDIVAD